MASSIPIQTIENPVLGRPFFLRKNRHSSIPSGTTTTTITPSAKLRLCELLGGRGLCNGEQGLQKELHQRPAPSPTNPEPRSGGSPSSLPLGFGADAFEKELLGLTGGFPGGEKGLEKFIEENPPIGKEEAGIVFSGSKPKPPELPLLLPGMIVIVKNPKNPFYMFCGIVQRVTDGKVGVLFEGGNWDKLITFQLDELERRDKGPPMVNPKSAVLESIVQKSP